VPEGLLLVVWSSIRLWVVVWVGLRVQSFYLAMSWVSLSVGWVESKKLHPRTTLMKLPKQKYGQTKTDSTVNNYITLINHNYIITTQNNFFFILP